MDNRRQSGVWKQNPETGFYEQQPLAQSGPYQYYEPPARTSGEKRRSYADRAGNSEPATYRPTQNGVQRSDSRKIRDLAEGVTQKLNKHQQGTTSEQLARTQHINSTRLPASSAQAPLRIDPNAAPDNVRNKPWSPDLSSPRTQPKQRHASTASNASELLRRGSVPDRSPLQKLEMEFASKGEKRARMEEAERKARQKSVTTQAPLPAEGELLRHGTLRSEKARVVSDGSRRPNEGVRREERPRQVSAEAPAGEGAENGGQRFRRATEALRKETRREGNEYALGHRRAVPAGAESRSHYGNTAPLREAKPVQHQGSHEREPASTMDGTVDLGRSSSKYRRRARDAGFVGAAAAMAGGVATPDAAADRGRAAHERRKSRIQQSPQASPISLTNPEGGFGRSNSRKLQKRGPPQPTERHGRGEEAQRGVQPQHGRGEEAQRSMQPQSDSGEAHATRQALQTDRMGGTGKNDHLAAVKHQDADPLPREQVALAPQDPLNYKIMPQTATGQDAREQVGFGAETSPVHSQLQEKHHRFGGMVHRNDHEHRPYQSGGKPLEEWRTAGTAKLTAEDLEYEQRPTTASGGTASEKDAAWWEKNGRWTSSSESRQGPPQYDGPYEEEAKHFRPPLYLTCGPLLRFTGIRREAAQQSRSGRSACGEREIWRGSIMIVTDDRQSDYASTPTLRLFGQPMDLHTPPPKQLLESGQELPPEFEDPVAAQVKLSRTGRALYVRHVHEIDGEVDLSREENPQGLFAATRTPTLGPQNISGPDGRQSQHITFQNKPRGKRNAAEKAGRYREVRACRLHAERGYSFWRFNVEVELGSTGHRVAYRINKGPAVGFWVPARGETMNIMFHSCNGFSLAVDPNLFSGPDPLWRDVLNRHQVRPFHVMLGGGDQIYNDAAMRDTKLFAAWLRTKNPEHKHRADFTPEMQDELETFYLERYAMWFSQGLFGMANAQIPMVNVWDDHDIIDGFGSYPHHFMSSRVFTGLGAVAFKYYMLFQHQSVVAETQREEPSWMLGASPGPYINELSRSVFMFLGRKVAFLGLDCRTERMRDEVLSQESYDRVFDRCRAEIVRGETKHLVVLLGVPIAYPRLNFLENILTSRVMDPIKAVGRTGMLGGFVNKFDGGVEILDDLDDHWTAKHHKAERNWFIQELQELAAEKSVRVTILGGDVHLGAVGQFYTPRKFGVAKDRDHRYMPNIVSSAIVNTPPPVMMADALNRRNKVHHLDGETDEGMIPMFEVDVGGEKRNNRCLLPRRNYCTIREFAPGGTPPGSPGLDGAGGSGEGGAWSPGEREGERRYPPGSMKRTMSLTRGPAKLVRRLSGSGRSKNASADGQEGMQRANSLGGSTGSYFPVGGGSDAPQRPTNQFHRRPTSLSVKEARKAAAQGGPMDGVGDEGREPGHIDLQSGLDVSLCMEVDQRDPGGATVPYRLLVPALWYGGEGDPNTLRLRGHGGVRLMGKLRGQGRHDAGEERGGSGGGSLTPSPPPSRGQQLRGPAGAAAAGAVVGGGLGHYGNDGPYADEKFANDESAPRPDAFKARRPSFMDRLKGRGKRDLDDDDYSSRSGSPSPRPSRGYPQDVRGPEQAGVMPPAQREPYSADGRYADGGIPGEQRPFKTRRPSFMDRLRGRGKREMDEDDYSSRSGTPSPPPSRGQPQMPHQPGHAPMPPAQREPYAAEGGFAGEQRPFKTRRPSLMDRLRGRGRQEVGDDGYSRSPTPSPPPSRGLPQHLGGHEDAAAMAGAQRRGPYQAEGPHTQAGRRIASDTHGAPPAQTAYSKGYNLSSPPIGSAPQPAARSGPGVGNNPYPQSGIRHSSAPTYTRTQQPGRQQPLANEPWRQIDECSGGGSLTGSDEYLDDKAVKGRRQAGTQQGRRPSKAERFFGIGDDGGPWGGSGGGRRPSMQEGGGYGHGDEGVGVGGKKNGGWKVWK